MNTVIILLSAFLQIVTSQTTLVGNGNSDNTYELINSVLGGTAVEPPDCGHEDFGPHITQEEDNELGRDVFAFHIHVDQDDDRCINYDRQRNEIKTYQNSPDYLIGFEGDTVSFSWNMKLDKDFQPSTKFTHVHQIKAGDGDDSLPLVTITPRSRSGNNILEVIYIGRDGEEIFLAEDDLSNYVGVWIHIEELITYGDSGELILRLSRLDTGEELMYIGESGIDLWRDETTFIRPKWGIYRSLGDSGALRDETVMFDSFCLGKDEDRCEDLLKHKGEKHEYHPKQLGRVLKKAGKLTKTI